MMKIELADVPLSSLTTAAPTRSPRRAMERAVLLHGGSLVRAEDLGFSGGKAETPVIVRADGKVTVDFSAGGIVLDEVERQLIVEALQASDWNRGRAAQLLGISKDTLRYRIEKYQIQQP